MTSTRHSKSEAIEMSGSNLSFTSPTIVGTHKGIDVYSDPKNTESNRDFGWKYYYFPKPDVVRDDKGNTVVEVDLETKSLIVTIQLCTPDDKKDALEYIQFVQRKKKESETLDLRQLNYLPFERVDVDLNDVRLLLPQGVTLNPVSGSTYFTSYDEDTQLPVVFDYESENAKISFQTILRNLKIRLTFHLSGKKIKTNIIHVTAEIFNGTSFQKALNGVNPDSKGQKYIQRNDLRQLIKSSKAKIKIDSYIENDSNASQVREKVYQLIDKWVTDQDKALVEWKPEMTGSTYNMDDLKTNVERKHRQDDKNSTEDSSQHNTSDKTTVKTPGVGPIGGAEVGHEGSDGSKIERKTNSEHNMEYEGEFYTPQSIMVIALNDTKFDDSWELGEAETYATDEDFLPQHDILLRPKRTLSPKGVGSPQILPGMVLSSAGLIIPSGYFLADGRQLNINDENPLFLAIRTTYGGDGVTTFNLPDLRSRMVMGSYIRDDKVNPIELSCRNLGDKGGLEKVKLEEKDLPQHNHDYSYINNPTFTNHVIEPIIQQPIDPQTAAMMGRFAIDGRTSVLKSFAAGANVTTQTSTWPAGVHDQPHENMPPYIALNYIIKGSHPLSGP